MIIGKVAKLFGLGGGEAFTYAPSGTKNPSRGVYTDWDELVTKVNKSGPGALIIFDDEGDAGNPIVLPEGDFTFDYDVAFIGAPTARSPIAVELASTARGRTTINNGPKAIRNLTLRAQDGVARNTGHITYTGTVAIDIAESVIESEGAASDPVLSVPANSLVRVIEGSTIQQNGAAAIRIEADGQGNPTDMLVTDTSVVEQDTLSDNGDANSNLQVDVDASSGFNDTQAGMTGTVAVTRTRGTHTLEFGVDNIDTGGQEVGLTPGYFEFAAGPFPAAGAYQVPVRRQMKIIGVQVRHVAPGAGNEAVTYRVYVDGVAQASLEVATTADASDAGTDGLATVPAQGRLHVSGQSAGGAQQSPRGIFVTLLCKYEDD